LNGHGDTEGEDMNEEEENHELTVNHIGDGWWELDDGQVIAFDTITDVQGKEYRIIGYDYLGMTEYPPLTCKECHRTLDEHQLLLQLAGGHWVVPHRHCQSFVWYRERRVLE
tara:strand:- start:172 stop:507 length:336 start_codon:yes stop_codon:yes gene_type:complete